jgi:hypothetical protein
VFSSTLKKSVAALAVGAGLLVASVPAGAVVPAPSGPAQSSTVPAAGGATSQGIIMRDGGVCDPIRHMGC